MGRVSEIYDLIVVGAGPAGASAAIMAARCGARVLLLERSRFPRHKVCGEFVSAESLGLLSTLLYAGHRSLLEQSIPIARTRIFFDGRTVQTPIDPPASSIARFDLDIALWESAVETGVDARSPVGVAALDLRDQPTGLFRVHTTTGEFASRAMINATGRWSTLTGGQKQKEGAGEKWLGLKAHFGEPAPQKSVDLYFFAGGYCGVQPVDLAERRGSGRVNACAVVRADVASSLAEVFTKHSALHARSRAWLKLSHPVSTSPLIFRKPQAVRDGVLQAGDAAAFVDPFVGDGISLALRSGGLAAQSLMPFLQGSRSYDDAVRDYQCAHEKHFGAIFRTSSKIRRMLKLPKTFRRPLLFMLERNPAATRYLIRKTR
jgi:flavin-dependent dehydrogenase